MIDYNLLCSILAGVCMLSENEVNNCDVTYLYHRWVGTCYKMQIEERSRFEVARYQSIFVVNGYVKKPVKKPQELGKFPWETEQKTLSPEKIKHLKKYAN